MQVIQIYPTEAGWCALVDNAGQRLTLTYKQQPQNAAVLADATAVFNPPTAQVTAEDGTVLNLVGAKALALTLTPAQRTALATAQTTIEALMARIVGVLPSDPAVLAVLRQHSAYLDWLLSIHERLGA